MAELVIKLVNGELAGKTIQGINKELTAANLALKKAEIGTQDYVNASKKLDEVKKLHGDIKKQQDSVAAGSELLKKAWNQLPGAGFFNQISSSFVTMKAGVGGLVSQFGVLKTAIAATGLGLLVIVLGGLFNWLSKIESITNIVKGAWEGLTASANQLFNAISTLDFTNLGENMAKAAKEGYNLVQVFDELEDKQRELDLTNAQAGKTLDQLLLKSRNVQLSYKERIELLDQADVLEESQSIKRLEYARAYEEAVLREAENSKHLGENEDDVKDKILAAKKAVIDAEREDIALREKIANRRAALEEKEQAQREKNKVAIEKENERKRKEAEEREKAIDEEFAQLEKQHLAELDLKQKQFDALSALEKADKAKIKAKEEAENKEQFDRDVEALNRRKQLLIDQAAFESNLADYKLQTAQRVGLGIADLALQSINNEKKAKELKKKIALADIGINLVAELSANAKNAAANPLNAVTFSAAGAAQLTATNIRSIVMAAINVAKITGFRKGGDTGYGNINDVAGVVHKKEYVVPAWMNTNPKLSGVMGMLEGIRNNGFKVGGPVNPFDNSRGPVSSGNAASPGSSSSALIDYNLLGKVIANEMKNSISTIQVQNNLSDVRNGLNTLQKLSADANI